jgi:hypothetical protein
MIWKEIKGIEGYSVSDSGTVRNDRTSTILKSYLRRDGYMSIVLLGNGKYINKKIHRLVAKYFVPNPHNYKEVNHKDEDKTNNCASNLEWCNRKYNVNYGNRSKKVSQTLLNNNHNKRVLQYDKNGNFIKE